MQLSFRQGLVQYQPNFLTWSGPDSIAISTSNSPIIVAFAFGSSNYIHTESTSSQYPVIKWTGLPVGQTTDIWIYWDIDTLTAQVSYGWTIHQPVVSAVDPFQTTIPFPTIPPDDQHWFDTTQKVMKVWNGSAWVRKIRVFAAKIKNSSAINPYPTGTQVAITIPCNAGRILFDSSGKPIKKSDGSFATTEDVFFVEGQNYTTSRLETSIFTGKAIENIPGFSVVKLVDFEQFALADYEDANQAVLGMALNDATYGEVISVVVQGVITNPMWNWQIPNTKLYVNRNGELTTSNPGFVEPDRGFQQAIARVISPISIMFGQGLDNTSGVDAEIVLPNASVNTKGVTKLSTTPVDSSQPIAVGDNDPRMTNARQPLPHMHISDEILHGTENVATKFNSVDLALLQKLDVTGGVMTGSLVLSDDPTGHLEAATKQYVDNNIVSNISAITLDGLANVNTVGKNNGFMISWNELEGKWNAVPPPSGVTVHGLLSGLLDDNHPQYALADGTRGNFAPVSHTHPYLPLTGGTLTGSLSLPGNPTNDLHATTKFYVDSKVAAELAYYLPLTGGTLTGSLFLNTNPTAPMHAVTKEYVDNQLLTKASVTHNHDVDYVNVSGDTMIGFLTLNANPTAPMHAATKQYVDTSLVGTAKTFNANVWTKAQSGAFTTLFSSNNSLYIDMQVSNNFVHTLTENTTLPTPINPTPGQSGMIEFNQGSTPRTLSFSSFWKFVGGNAPSLTNTANAKDVLIYVVNAAGTSATCTMLNDVK